MARLYLLLTIIGTVLPLAVFFGLIGDFPAVQGSLLAGFFPNVAAAAATTDVLWASVVFLIWMGADSRRMGFGFPWWIIPINAIVGLCAALPLYLWLRETRQAAE
nr:DUF2834 domain-containing protein [Oceanococcus sp. HetDA_MAG_MS8]